MGNNLEISGQGKNAVATATTGKSRYFSAAATSLGLPQNPGRSINLGGIVPITSLPMLERIVEERCKAIDGMLSDPLIAGTNRNPSPSAQALRNRRPMSYRAYLRAIKPNWKEGPVEEAFIYSGGIFKENRHTPTLQGYASYLCDLDPALANLISTPIPLPLPADERKRHTYIVGAAGSGKSELLKILIHEEIASNQSSVVVVDAHSDLCEQLARWPDVANDPRLVFIAPAAIDGMMPTLNPLQPPKGADDRAKEIISNRLSEVLGDICRGEGGSSMSVRMISVGKAACRVLLDRPGSTLEDLYKMLSESPPPELIKAGKDHPDEGVSFIFKNEWDASDYKAAKAGMRARLVNLLLHKDFRQMTCGPSTVPLYELVDGGKIALFSLGKAGTDSAKVIGKLLVSMLAAIGDLRKDSEREDRKPVHIFLDECHNFIGPATQTILAELRKYGLHLTLANQFLKQIPMDDRDSLLANTQIKILGRSDYAPTMLQAMGSDDDTGKAIARSLTMGNFMVKWGAATTFTITTRSDYADESRSVDRAEWDALRVRQRSFYRSVQGLPGFDAGTAPEAAPEDAKETFRLDLD